MSQPIILQIGPYSEWDQVPLEHAFNVRRLFETDLSSGVLESAALDVFEGEPELDPRFWN